MKSLIGLLHSQVTNHPARVAVIDGDRRYSFQDLWESIQTIARLISAHSEESKPPHVAIWLDNGVDYITCYYAAMLAGAVVIPLNTQNKWHQIKPILINSEVTLAFTDSKRRNKEAANLTKLAVSWFTVEEVEESIADTASFNLDSALAKRASATQALATIIYTSGTTGSPKGVMLSAANLAANTLSIIEYLRLRCDDIGIAVLPFFYSYGNSVLHTHLAVGASLVIENQFLYPQKVLEKMQAYQVTGFSAVPAMYATLLERLDLNRFPFPALRYATVAGGAIRGEHLRQILDTWSDVEFFNMYGQTEATARLTYHPTLNARQKLDSIGIPIPGCDLSIRDDTGAQLADEDEGEICARGPNVMLGYWKDSEATAAKMHGDWLRTGDIGHRDSEGYFYIYGRNSDMIKSGAHRIAPEEIEEVIGMIPGVKESAVCGYPDKLLGEVIIAFVVVNDSTLAVRTIMQRCNQCLPKYKLPKKIEFVASLPRTASGKLQRYKLLQARET